MRLALISFEFPPATLGGIGTYARHAVEMLQERGHDVTVFAGTTTGTGGRETWAGATVHRLPCPDRRAFHAVAVPALVAEHRRRPFEVAEVPDLYAEGRGLRAAAPDLPFILRAHTPLYIPSSIDFHALPGLPRALSGLRRLVGGLRQHQPWARTFHEARSRVCFGTHFDVRTDPERQVALEADLVVPPSQRLASRLLADWHLDPGRMRLLPYTHRPSPELLALPVPKEIRTIGFHGSIRFFKGVHVLVAALPRVLARHPSLHIALAGTSAASPVAGCTWRGWRDDRMVEWKDTLEWLRPQLAALGDRVTLRGFVPPEKLAGHLGTVDLSVFPSLFDNFPSACLEAMSAARAIVATRSGGMEEMLGHEEAGLLVAPDKVSALADAICRLIENPALGSRLARQARARVLSLYSSAAIGPRHEAIYHEAIARRQIAQPVSE